MDENIIRTHNPPGLVKWDKEKKKQNCDEWFKCLRIAAKRPNLGGILAIYDGDAKNSQQDQIHLFVRHLLEN